MSYLILLIVFASGAFADGPELFSPGHDECVRAAANPPINPSFLVSVKSYGAIGDGKSHTIGALEAANQLSLPLRKSIEVLNTVLWSTYKVQPTDEADWVGIQAALVAAHKNQGGRVVIPPTTGDYLVNRPVWVYSNVTLTWTGSNYIRPTKSLGGSVITSANVYDRPVAAAYNDHVCNVRIVNPHVDGGGNSSPVIYGQNGISFINGSQDIYIYGGHVRNTLWGTIANKLLGHDPQGGRAFQFESGVKNVYLNGTLITGATIGVSSAGGLCAFKKDNICNASGGTFFAFRPHEMVWPASEYSRNIAWNINVSNVVITDTELPFMFANLLFGKTDSQGRSYYETEIIQKVSLGNFIVRRSGTMRASTLEYGAKPEDGAIVTLIGANNVKIIGGKVNNSNYPKIHAAISGFGRNIGIADIYFIGDTDSVLDFGGNVGLRTIQNVQSENVYLSRFQHRGTSRHFISGNSVMNASFGSLEYDGISESFFNPELLDNLSVEEKMRFRMSIRPLGTVEPYVFSFPFIEPLGL